VRLNSLLVQLGRHWSVIPFLLDKKVASKSAEYVTKASDLRAVNDDIILFAQNTINYYPNKCLKFKRLAVAFKQLAA
jgi:hypothetical protein